jgi:hypothetical protein
MALYRSYTTAVVRCEVTEELAVKEHLKDLGYCWTLEREKSTGITAFHVSILVDVKSGEVCPA